MMSRTLRALAAVLAVALIGAVGCDTEEVTSSTAALTVRYVPSPAGVGRYETANFDINTITFLPVDEDLVPLLHGDSFTMRFGAYTTDLSLTEPDTYAEIAIPPGTYRITSFRIRRPLFTDQGANPAAANCIERISSVPSGPAESQVEPFFELDESAGYVFTVAPGQTNLDLAIDVPGLISAYETAFTCELSCGGGSACLSSFNPDTFIAGFIENVTIQ